MSFIVFNCHVVEWVDIFANSVFKNPGILILATIFDIFPENPLINLFRYYSAQPVSILTFARGTQRQFSENICSVDDLISGIFGTFIVNFFACLPLLGFSNIQKMV